MKKLENEPTDSGKRLWFVSDTYNSGVVGMMQALRMEPAGSKVRYLFCSELDSTAQKPTVEQLKKTVVPLDLYENTFRSGQLGFFAYRDLDSTYMKKDAHADDAFVTVPTLGDPSSAHWASTNKEVLGVDDFMRKEKDKFVNVYYATVNDRDVAFANGEFTRTADTLS